LHQIGAGLTSHDFCFIFLATLGPPSYARLTCHQDSEAKVVSDALARGATQVGGMGWIWIFDDF
jgi:hypothetical protein